MGDCFYSRLFCRQKYTKIIINTLKYSKIIIHILKCTKIIINILICVNAVTCVFVGQNANGTKRETKMDKRKNNKGRGEEITHRILNVGSKNDPEFR